MQRTVVVTGGAGYLGSHLVPILLARGWTVRVLDLELFGNGLEGLKGQPNLAVATGDVRSVANLARSFNGADAVIHLAAVVGDAACRVDPDYTWATNVEATKLVVDVARHYGVGRLLYASSCSVYGASDDLVLNEGSLRRPVSLYAETRIESEDICLRASGNDLTVTCLRMATLYGLSPRMRFDLVVNTMTARAVADRLITVFGGSQWRPLVHVGDAAEAFALALEAPSDVVNAQVFNVGSDDQNYQMLTLGKLIARALGEVPVNVRPPSEEDLRNYRVSFAKIAHLLRYRSSRSVDEACIEIRDHLATDPGLDYRESRFNNHRYAYSIDPTAPPRPAQSLRAADEPSVAKSPEAVRQRP